VKTVGAGLYPDVYNRAIPPALFRLGILRGIEFLDRIDGQNGGSISDAVTGVHKSSGTALAYLDNTLYQQEVIPGTPAIGARVSGGASHGLDHSRTQLEQALEITAIQGQ